jgi:acyl-CoA synthetase (AMP-forming)/AMP-acid ligase II
MRITIRSQAGEPLPSGQVGEIVVNGNGVMSGYFNDPAATAGVLRDGWLHTGDLGSLDADGFLWLAGRLRNLIITAGRNVAAEEVEAHLRQLPGVTDAAVFGEPDRLRGEVIHALIVTEPGVLPAGRDVRVALTTSLEKHKIPRRISIVGELPRTATGKIDRARLRLFANRKPLDVR